LVRQSRAQALGPFAALVTSQAYKHYILEPMPAPLPSTQPDLAALAGTVERVRFHNAESGFCVLRIKGRKARARKNAR